MLVRTALVTPFMQNARVLIDEATRSGMVIDPGGDVEKILPLLQLDGRPLDDITIYLTHAHLDHAGGVSKVSEYLKKMLGREPQLLAHRLERDFRANVSQSAMMFGLSPNDFENVREPDRYLEDGDIVRVGELSGKVLFTPGHSPGHIALYFESGPVTLAAWEAQPKPLQLECPVLIGGDLLFQGSVGRTDLPGGDGETLIHSVVHKVFVLPEDTRVLAGHGGDTTVGVEKHTNPFFQ
ncbi:MAG: MBL fold metallo-hydrolase [Bdellovibrionota bacterium]